MALSITIVVGIVYYVVMGSDDADETVTLDVTSSEAAQKTAAILADTQKINDFKMDTSILSDARFSSLQNFRLELVDVPTGRSNPFEPVQ